MIAIKMMIILINVTLSPLGLNFYDHMTDKGMRRVW